MISETLVTIKKQSKETKITGPALHSISKVYPHHFQNFYNQENSREKVQKKLQTFFFAKSGRNLKAVKSERGSRFDTKSKIKDPSTRVEGKKRKNTPNARINVPSQCQV